jgi:hypothetical protein
VDNANNNNSNDRSLLIKRIINMSKEKEIAKFITVLDFEVGKVFQYEIGENNWNPDHESMEEFLSGVGHNLSNCEWMCHENPEIITP